MDKIYEFNCTKGRTIRVTDNGVDIDRANKAVTSGSHRSNIEKYVDEQMFAGRTVYFEDLEKAESYVPAWLDILMKTKKVRVESDGTASEFSFTVLDIDSEGTDYEDSVDNSSGTINLIRITLREDSNEEKYVLKPILILYYEYEIKEKEVINY